jgi:hypothetical protein
VCIGVFIGVIYGASQYGKSRELERAKNKDNKDKKNYNL